MMLQSIIISCSVDAFSTFRTREMNLIRIRRGCDMKNCDNMKRSMNGGYNEMITDDAP